MRNSPNRPTVAIAAVALIAGAQASTAQSPPRAAAPELRVTAEGKIVPSGKAQDRVPQSVQMAFEDRDTVAGAPCPAQSALTPAAAEVLVRRVAEAEAFFPEFVLAVARRESRFEAKARSDAGAYGLMQLMPATAERFGVDRCDPEENVRGGIRYLRLLWERLRNPFYILAAYNAGEAAVAEYKGVPPYPETVAFVAAVISDFYGYPPPNAPIGAASDPSAVPAAAATPVAAVAPRRASPPRPASSRLSRSARATPSGKDWLVLHVE